MSRILITVPAWNEASVIAANVKTLYEACEQSLTRHDWQIEVVDNASQDETRAIITELSQTLDRLSLRSLPVRGKGGAIQTSWWENRDRFDAFVFLDADLAADIQALPGLVEPILFGQADMVCGSRFEAGIQVKRSLGRRFLSFLYRIWQQWLLHLPVQDAQCGFKAVSPRVVQEILPSLQEQGWLFDTELLAHVAQKNYRVIALPVDWMDRRYADRRSALSVWRDGWDFIFGVWRVRRRMRKNGAWST